MIWQSTGWKLLRFSKYELQEQIVVRVLGKIHQIPSPAEPDMLCAVTVLAASARVPGAQGARFSVQNVIRSGTSRRFR